MKLSDFDYKLPKELIATEPIKPRDHSRLLLLDKLSGEIQHQYFHDLLDYLQRGDVLVLNNSKVFPARLIGHKETGGQVEVFLHQKLKPTPTPLQGGELWNCILGGRIREGILIKFDKNLVGKILKNNNDGTWEVEFNKTGNDFMKLVEKTGKVPIPPYIEKQRNPQRYLKPNRVSDTQDYQTVYADNNKVGSVAAPTAGFHFTPRLLKKIKNKGVQIEYVTLHVGLGTFAPVKVDNIKKHKMHAEFVEINKEVAQKILKAKKEKRRIIAVGTTSLRTLEGVLSLKIKKPINQLTTYQLPINIFIYPGYKFKIVDAMITNFHLPKSTLLMLVSALAGQEKIKKAYQEAIDKKYRFYSYGDAMFIY
jgi:S-adenosylmethionine:tRNA ribosyltransferase-isomerase